MKIAHRHCVRQTAVQLPTLRRATRTIPERTNDIAWGCRASLSIFLLKGWHRLLCQFLQPTPTASWHKAFDSGYALRGSKGGTSGYHKRFGIQRHAAAAVVFVLLLAYRCEGLHRFFSPALLTTVVEPCVVGSGYI